MTFDRPWRESRARADYVGIAIVCRLFTSGRPRARANLRAVVSKLEPAWPKLGRACSKARRATGSSFQSLGVIDQKM